MWKTFVEGFKELIEWKKYNSVNSYILYFLSEYGNESILYKNKVNVCDLTRLVIKSTFRLTFFAALVLLGLSSVLGYVFSWMLVFKFGTVEVISECELFIPFVLYNAVILAVFLVYVSSNVYEYIQKLLKQRKLAKKLQEEQKLGEEKEPNQPSLLVEWYHATKNKYCFEIDLTKFRK